MASVVKTKKLKIGGMTCINCQNKIENKLRNTAGIKSVNVSYSKGTAEIVYDIDIISLKNIQAVIKKLGYSIINKNQKQHASVGYVAGILLVIIFIYFLFSHFGILNMLVPSQLADSKMGYGMLFIIGLLTSVHCIAMCGGINLSQCIPQSNLKVKELSKTDTFKPALFYNLGRVISYTVVGFILGFVGLLFGGGSDVGIPVIVQGILKLIAGDFMIIMGINMLGIFPFLRKIQPRIPKFFGQKLGKEKNRSPLIVGMLNGLMPCGPLQSMQIVALASGNPFIGALSMFVFSLGTVPLMLGFGSVISALGKKFTDKVMNIGAVLVVVLGLAMISQGGSLSGFFQPNMLLVATILLCAVGVVYNIPFKKERYKRVSTFSAFVIAVALLSLWSTHGTSVGGGSGLSSNNGIEIVEGKQIVNSTLYPGGYPNITVQVGTPVKWTIDAPEGSINGCNNRINIKEYGVNNYSFNYGENVIEFTPERTGKFQYSCWMGMIYGSITVVDVGEEVTQNDTADRQKLILSNRNKG